MTLRLLVGTYTRGTASEGIYQYRLSPRCDEPRLIAIHEDIDNPSFIIKNPARDIIYAVNEIPDFLGTDSGAVSAFKLDRDHLELISQRSTRGADPCHLSINSQATCLLVANYSGGSLITFPLSSDGSISDAPVLIAHEGKGADPQRQARAHVHSTTLSPNEAYAYVADLGLDQVVQYPLDQPGQRLNTTQVEAGAGPRHFCFSGQFGYLLNELDNTIVSFSYDRRGQLRSLFTYSSLPEACNQVSYGAHIDSSRDGKYLYASNRGDDSIAVFAIEPEGHLRPIQFISSAGKHPRHFILSPDQQFLLVANRDSNNVVVFRRNTSTGLIAQTATQLEVPAPVCLLFG